MYTRKFQPIDSLVCAILFVLAPLFIKQAATFETNIKLTSNILAKMEENQPIRRPEIFPWSLYEYIRLVPFPVSEVKNGNIAGCKIKTNQQKMVLIVEYSSYFFQLNEF